MSETPKHAVVLLAFGGADSVDDVEEFIGNVLSPRPARPELIIDARKRYEAIGGSSPLLAITTAEGRALEKRLCEEVEGGVRVFVGMRNWTPYIKDTLAEIKEAGYERATAVIMAPHTTTASTGGYKKAVDAALEELGGEFAVDYIERWHTAKDFLDAVGESMDEAIEELGGLEGTRVIFSAHSLPEFLLEDDPYVDLIEESIAEVNKRYPGIDSTLAYQSKGGGPFPWLGPAVEEAIEGAKADGKKNVLVVPIGFISDHVETLYDIDILFKGKAEELGLGFARSASLNTSPRFIEALVKGVTSRLS